MKNFTLVIFLMIICQIIFSCSDSSIVPSKGGVDNRVIYFDSNKNIFISDEVITNIDTFITGGYPIWMDSKRKVGFHSSNNLTYYILDTQNKDTLQVYDITGYGTFMFGRYSETLDVFTFAVNHHGQPSLAIMDSEGNIDIITREYRLGNPVFSGSDDWLYYFQEQDGTLDINRMKIDGSQDESITDEKEFAYGNFSVSYDGNYIVAPKRTDELKYFAVINTNTKDERLINMTELNSLGYTSLSKDNKYIYFTSGNPSNLYRINFDGTELIQLTDDDVKYIRPLVW